MPHRNDPHTVQSYDNELDAIQAAVRRMGAMTAEQVAMTIRAFEAGDIKRARTVIDVDAQVDKLEAEINDMVVHLLAKRAPVAIDLREILSSLKIAGFLERIGDYAKNCAKRVRALENGDAVSPIRYALVKVGTQAEVLIREVMDAHTNRDAMKALAVWEADAELDALHAQTHQVILNEMRKNPDALHDFAHMMFFSKNLERIGDHCTNIAEEVHFFITGHEPEDQRPKADNTSSV